MQTLTHQLERTVVIRANPEQVFQFFTDRARWAIWWGAGSTIDARPGGKVYIRHANGVETMGEVLEVVETRRIVFTYGYPGGKPMLPDGSRVTIDLEADTAGTRLHLLHEFSDAAPRDEHIQGWRFQLSLFSNAVTNEVFADAAHVVDDWFAAWIIADPVRREESLKQIAVPAVRFRDHFSLLDGLEDLTAHIGAAQRFMPGMSLRRKGDVRQCQGTALADWVATSADGQERMSGTSVIVFAPDGRIRSLTSLANVPKT